jgi:integrase
MRKGESKMLMSELFAKFEAECFDELKPRTQQDYRRMLRVLDLKFGPMTPEEVKPRHIVSFLDVPVGRIARNRCVMVLSLVFHKSISRWCISDSLTNPCVGIERWPEKPRDRYVGDLELARFRAICSEPLQIMIDLATLTGQRQGDLLDLKWSMVHADFIEFTQSKTNRHLGVRLTSALAAVLKQAKAMRPSGEYVVRNQFGDRYTSFGFRAMWGRHMRKWVRMGNEPFTNHDLRAKSGSDSSTLQAAYERLGHADISITRRCYERSIRMVDALR